MSTSVLLVGGALAPNSPPPMGMLAAAPDGLAGGYVFVAPAWDDAARNLVAYPQKGTLVGSVAPVLNGQYAAFPGNGNHLDTGLYETNDFGIMALARVAPGTVGNRRLLTNISTPSTAGMTFTIISSGAIRLDVLTSGGQNQEGNVASQALTDWVLVTGKVSGMNKRIRNLGEGTSSDAVMTGTRVLQPPPASLVTGSLRTGGAQGNFPMDMFALLITLGRAPSDEEEDANGTQLRQMAASYGITLAQPA